LNEKDAKNIIKCGIIPGEIDSVDLWRAEGYIEAIEKAKKLAIALEYVVDHLKFTGKSGNYVDYIVERLEEWEKTK